MLSAGSDDASCCANPAPKRHSPHGYRVYSLTRAYPVSGILCATRNEAKVASSTEREHQNLKREKETENNRPTNFIFFFWTMTHDDVTIPQLRCHCQRERQEKKAANSKWLPYSTPSEDPGVRVIGAQSDNSQV